MPPGRDDPIDLTGIDDGEDTDDGAHVDAQTPAAQTPAAERTRCDTSKGSPPVAAEYWASADVGSVGVKHDLASVRAAARRRWESQQEHQLLPHKQRGDTGTAATSPVAVPTAPTAAAEKPMHAGDAVGKSPLASAVNSFELAPGVPAAAFQLQRVRGLQPEANR